MFGRKKKNKQAATIPLDATAQYVGFWYRAGAALVDLVLIAALAVPFVLLAAGGFEEPGLLHGVIIGLAILVYFLAFWWWKSRTPGLWLVSAKIVDIRRGDKPELWQCVARFFGLLLSLLAAGLGLFWIGWAARHRGWPDYLAKTAVIGDETLRPLTREERRNLADTVDWSSETSH